MAFVEPALENNKTGGYYNKTNNGKTTFKTAYTTFNIKFHL